MIKITVSRNGMLKGTSIVPTRDVHNVYFLFGTECSEDNQELFSKRMDEANALYKKVRGTDHKGGVMPEYCLRTLLLWQHLNFNTAISYPETALIPGVQSYLMCLFVVMQRANPDKDLEIITVSEYIIRMGQLLVAAGEIASDEVQVYDTQPDGEPEKMNFQIPDEFTLA